MNREQINELQDHFDGRSRLKKAIYALKCYPKGASIYYSYVDGWNNKKNVNIPIEPSDLIPILEKYVEAIDNDIVKLTFEEDLLKVCVQNGEEVEALVEGYKQQYPETFIYYQQVLELLKEAYVDRAYGEDSQGDATAEDYHVQILSDWEDKVYVFKCLGEAGNTVYFWFKGVAKI